MAEESVEVLNSLDDKCTHLRLKYDSCFSDWFREDFLKGKSSDHQTVCGELFNAYQQCLKKALDEKDLNKSELYENILSTSKENVPPSQ